jgi:chromosome segregation ATPase
MFETIKDAECTCTALMRRIQELEKEHRLYMQSAEETNSGLRVVIQEMDELADVQKIQIDDLGAALNKARNEITALKEKYVPDDALFVGEKIN